MSQVAALFPGQGSQHVGMGRELADAFGSAADVFERANDALGFDLRRLAWEGPEEELRQTQNAQPALMVHSCAVWSVVRDELAPRLSYAAGHSLGEFSAYAAAGSLAFEEAVRLVRRRGELMAESPPGRMAAVVGLEASEIETICESVRNEGGIVVAANYNSPKQIVISGEPAAVERASNLAREAQARMVHQLAVSGAFHSPLMSDAEAGLREELEDLAFSDPQIPVISNVTAQPVTQASEARELLVKQLTSPVRWTDSMITLADLGVRQLVELGPGKVLTGLLKRIDSNLEGTSVAGPGDANRLREGLV